MTINPKVWAFPSFPISKQLFVATGAAIEGGMTVGGVRMISPEPGGRSMLEIQPSFQVTEWVFPLSSWLMSKTNGDIFRIRLAPTPQIAGAQVTGGVPWGAEGFYPASPWSNQQNWAGDAVAHYLTSALEGNVTVVLDMSVVGQILRPGHCLGHRDNCYMVDDIIYDDATNYATVTIKPPLRKAVTAGDLAPLRPWYLGTIANGAEMRASYDAENGGNIQLNRIRFSEVIL